jgi:hypothetical protein
MERVNWFEMLDNESGFETSHMVDGSVHSSHGVGAMYIPPLYLAWHIDLLRGRM